MLDILAVWGLGWLYDWVEDRYGRPSALLVTWLTALTLLAVIIWIFVKVLAR
jgi:hypothetical protein